MQTEKLNLIANKRIGKTKAHVLRKHKLIPAVVYGKNEPSQSIQVDYQTFRKLFKIAGTTSVINLNIDGVISKPVLIQDMQFHPVTDLITHIDFKCVNLKEKVTAFVPVELIGESPAAKNFNANIITVHNEIEVECLPLDIPHSIQLDISKLENIGDSFHVYDLNLGDKVTILTDKNEVIVTANAFVEIEETLNVEVPDELKTEPTSSEENKKEKSE